MARAAHSPPVTPKPARASTTSDRDRIDRDGRSASAGGARSPSQSRRFPVTRRRFIVGAGLAGIASTAGCVTLADWVAGRLLGEVNVFNESTMDLAGSIEVLAPAGTTALDATFSLGPRTDDEEADSQNEDEATASFDDVWTTTGEYALTVTLAADTEVRGMSTLETTLSIADPAAEMAAVVLGAEGLEDGIAVSVAERWSEFDRTGGGT